MIRLTSQMIRYPPGFRMGPHVDGCRRLSVLVSGDQEEAHRRTCVQAAFGSVALKAPELVHRNVFGGAGTTIISVQLPDNALDALGFCSDAVEPWSWHHRGAVALTGLRLAVGLRLRDSALVEECLVELLATFSRAHRPAGDPTSELLRRVRDRLHDEPGLVPSVRLLAADEGLHPVSLGRAFRRAFGLSITQYRQRLRVAAVAEALVGGEKPLVEVALDHGFSDSSHMTRVFHREIGAPPGCFQAQLGPATSRLDSFKTEWPVEV